MLKSLRKTPVLRQLFLDHLDHLPGRRRQPASKTKTNSKIPVKSFARRHAKTPFWQLVANRINQFFPQQQLTMRSRYYMGFL